MITHSAENAFNEMGEEWIALLQEILFNGKLGADDEQQLFELTNVHTSMQHVRQDDEVVKQFADPERIALLMHKYETPGFIYKGVDYGSQLYENKIAGDDDRIKFIDQIEWIIERFRKKPETKKATISTLKPGSDTQTCLTTLGFLIRGNDIDEEQALVMNTSYGTQDILNSHIGNLLAVRKIQEIIAKEVGTKVGRLDLNINSAHIYLKDYQKAAETCIGDNYRKYTKRLVTAGAILPSALQSPQING